VRGLIVPTKERATRSDAAAGSRAPHSDHKAITIARPPVFRMLVSALIALAVLPLFASRVAAAEVESDLRWPVSGNISADVSYHVLNENGTRAVDIANTEGTPLAAAHGGIVVHAGQTPQQYSCPALDGKTTYGDGFGYSVVIRHDGGTKTYYTMYAHLKADSVAVRNGQSVITGEFLGRMGSTGCSTGSHVHFEVGTRFVPGDGVNTGGYIDPTSSLWNAPEPALNEVIYQSIVITGSSYQGLGGPVTRLEDGVRVDGVQTGDANFQFKGAFRCGEPFLYLYTMVNTTGRTLVHVFNLYSNNPLSAPFNNAELTEAIGPGTTYWYNYFTLPKSISGNYYAYVAAYNWALNDYSSNTHPFTVSCS
jgi:murein DD-endopeptidase MepM/ murein hydrolase activator NlpD